MSFHYSGIAQALHQSQQRSNMDTQTRFMGSLGFCHLYQEQGPQKILTVSKHLNTPGQPANVSKATGNWICHDMLNESYISKPKHYNIHFFNQAKLQPLLSRLWCGALHLFHHNTKVGVPIGPLHVLQMNDRQCLRCGRYSRNSKEPRSNQRWRGNWGITMLIVGFDQYCHQYC